MNSISYWFINQSFWAQCVLLLLLWIFILFLIFATLLTCRTARIRKAIKAERQPIDATAWLQYGDDSKVVNIDERVKREGAELRRETARVRKGR